MLDKLIQDIKNTVNEIESEMPNIIVQTANDSKALIQRRVINTGEVGNGSSSNYKEGYYKRFRKEKGRQTNHKDYRFTGAMWGAIQAIPNTVKKAGRYFFTVDIDALDSENENKLKYNNQRDGVKILSNTEGEQTQLSGFIANKIKRIIDKNL